MSTYISSYNPNYLEFPTGEIEMRDLWDGEQVMEGKMEENIWEM